MKERGYVQFVLPFVAVYLKVVCSIWPVVEVCRVCSDTRVDMDRVPCELQQGAVYVLRKPGKLIL